MSMRLDVYDALVAALQGSTTAMSYVTKNLEQWWNWNSDRFPGVRVIDGVEERKPACYLASSTAVPDMEAKMNVTVSGYVQDLTNQGLSAMRSNLIEAIERIVMTDSTWLGKVLDVWPVSVETDEGVLDNYAWCECTFGVRYHYNHAST